MTDPYAPPSEPTQRQKISLEACPACGAEMEAGWVNGKLVWHAAKATLFQRFLGGRQVTGLRSFSFNMGDGGQAAYQCLTCGLLLVIPKK